MTRKMRMTSSFTHTGSVVLIRLVTSKSLRRKFMRPRPFRLISLIFFAIRLVVGRSEETIGNESRAARKGESRRPGAGQTTGNQSMFTQFPRRWQPMTAIAMESVEEVKRRISELNLEHRDLDRAIEALEMNPLHDELQLK